MTDHTIVAVYDTPAHAELAVGDMLQAGVPDSAVERHAQEGSYSGNSVALTSRPAQSQGFWASLFGGEPEGDSAIYDRSVQSGATVVTVRVPDEHVARVTQILESHAPVDLDDRARQYGAGGAQVVAGGDTLQLSEESLLVGKRLVNQGTTRVRRFAVETPVQQQVQLHEEHVAVDRHPVTDNRAATDADFANRVIELTETAEEAVVSRTVRVKEEIVIRKQATDRVETVRDTVRREDVEIIKIPGEDVSSTDTGTVTARTPRV